MYELASKEIVELFLGDKEINMYIDEVYVRYSMPNLTHSDINSLAPTFGINNIDTVNTYNRTDKMSWLIKQCYDLNKENKLLEYFLDKKRYISNNREDFYVYEPDELEEKINKEIIAYLNYINTFLYYCDKKLISISNKYKVIEIVEDVQAINDIDSHISLEYVRKFPFRLKDNLDSGNYDTVITQSRTLIEEVYIHILEYSDEDYKSAKGNLKRLNSMVKDYLNMKTDKEYDKRINQLLSGLNKINDAIGDMRNENSDSHGVGSKRIQVNRREARLIMNSAITLCDYVLDVFEDKKSKDN
ncbi:abortive infection family protein [Staphylococcus pettenkoferi]|uniref:Abortive infection family protein n=3 Tax=Bacteria TaxID=2 RepID=A0ABT4BNT3_9STAP|nr:abortive infection family protein [Staphylococcus pettenkoferi]MCY1565659.1 abortive infection family protein [Staphylococcus pettenkoferi]MCY1572793.1 abortive infection family protein [Staphylococcus pettenkoferi]MCY1584351.1 abortive infection family protein [Staphylococcus pettenkoferi]MCY1593589.1 abortive infection family protein [Staphylococcus pettenkoferi]MCY1600581.1 abortive infection family protein [Staphylococcus pettenkoferi]